ncbi:MAG: hypothetical protein OQK49_01145 [Proteobacteria bacterium]|nr:hypothetical protein [Pseudomonadota bacterium]
MLTPTQTVWLILSILLLNGGVQAAGLVQQGFYLHDIPGSRLTITNAKSGLVCSDNSGPQNVCSPAMKVLVTAKENCQYSPQKSYPCTRYGYEFNYDNAQSGDTLECKAIYTDTRGKKSNHYTHKLTANNGHIFHHAFKTFAPVKQRVLLSEVHECSYQGSPLMAIEFMHYYEPETHDNNDKPGNKKRIDTIPNACKEPHLSEVKAKNILNTEVKKHVASEHIPTLWSQCIYNRKSGQHREISFVYKFMLSDMFDVNRVEPQQLHFNATFASGNAPLTKVLEDLGDKAFVFNTEKRTTLLVITGIGGPKDGANRDQEFIANYYLDDKTMPQEERETLLIQLAREDLQHW